MGAWESASRVGSAARGQCADSGVEYGTRGDAMQRDLVRLEAGRQRTGHRRVPLERAQHHSIHSNSRVTPWTYERCYGHSTDRQYPMPRGTNDIPDTADGVTTLDQYAKRRVQRGEIGNRGKQDGRGSIHLNRPQIESAQICSGPGMHAHGKNQHATTAAHAPRLLFCRVGQGHLEHRRKGEQGDIGAVPHVPLELPWVSERRPGRRKRLDIAVCTWLTTPRMVSRSLSDVHCFMLWSSWDGLCKLVYCGGKCGGNWSGSARAKQRHLVEF